MAVPHETIGEWSPTTLTKFIRDLLQNQPPDFLPNLRAEEMSVVRRLTLGEELRFAQPNWREIGKTGNPPFENGWTNYGDAWATAAFWKDPLGIVHLRGLVKNGTAVQPIFTLPPGFRPGYNAHYAVPSNGAFAYVHALANGVIQMAGGSNAWLDLSSIHFRTT